MPQQNSDVQKKLSIFKEEGLLVEDENGQLRPVEGWYATLLHKVTSDPELAPSLQAYFNGFPKYDPSILLKLKNTYSLTLYPFLKQHEKKDSLSVDFDTMLLLLEVNKLDFKAIERAQKELKEKTDIYFEYTVEGEKIIFGIFKNDQIK